MAYLYHGLVGVANVGVANEDHTLDGKPMIIYMLSPVVDALPKGAKIYPVSGRRSHKRVPEEDLGNNLIIDTLTLHVVKGDLVGYVIDDPQTKQDSLDWGLPTVNRFRGRWCAWVWISSPPRTLHGVATLSVSQ